MYIWGAILAHTYKYGNYTNNSCYTKNLVTRDLKMAFVNQTPN